MLQGLVQAAQAQWDRALDQQATLEGLLATAEDCAATAHQDLVQISTNGCDTNTQPAELSIMPHGVSVSTQAHIRHAFLPCLCLLPVVTPLPGATHLHVPQHFAVPGLVRMSDSTGL